MALPDFDLRQLLEAGVHFGHQTHRWNPKMSPYIFGDRNGIHVIDLSKSVPLLHQALVAVRDVVASGGRVLFVGTKRQAAEPVARHASQCAQYYMNSRWLGGTLTNWKTISNSIKRLRELEEILSGGSEANAVGGTANASETATGETSANETTTSEISGATGLTKKEMLNLTRERDKLERALGGIKDMGGVPEIMFVIDTNKEAIAIAEAKTLGIPVVAILDSNCNPDNIDYPIPGNDDAARAIELYCNLVSKAVIDGIEESGVAAKIDMGAAEEPMTHMPADVPPQAETAQAETAQAETAQAETAEAETQAEVKNADEANADAPDIKDETPETEKGEDAEAEKSADA